MEIYTEIQTKQRILTVRNPDQLVTSFAICVFFIGWCVSHLKCRSQTKPSLWHFCESEQDVRFASMQLKTINAKAGATILFSIMTIKPLGSMAVRCVHGYRASTPSLMATAGPGELESDWLTDGFKRQSYRKEALCVWGSSGTDVYIVYPSAFPSKCSISKGNSEKTTGRTGSSGAGNPWKRWKCSLHLIVLEVIIFMIILC